MTRFFALSWVPLFSRFREPPLRAFGSILGAFESISEHCLSLTGLLSPWGGGGTHFYARSEWARLRAFERIPRQCLKKVWEHSESI